MDPWKKKLKLWKLYLLRFTPYTSVLAFLLFCAVFSIITTHVLPSSSSSTKLLSSSLSNCVSTNLSHGQLLAIPFKINHHDHDTVMVAKPLIPSSLSFHDRNLYYSTVFKRLFNAGFISIHSKSLTLDNVKGEDIVVLKNKIGVHDVTGIVDMPSELFIVSGQKDIRHPFENDTFDFEFFGYNTRFKYWTSYPAYTASEIGRTLKVGGFVVIHLVINDQYSFNSFVNLFKWCCTLVSSNPLLLLQEGHDDDHEYLSTTTTTTMHELVFRKEEGRRKSSPCESRVRRNMIKELEPLYDFESPYSWEGTFGYDKVTLKYVPNMVDLSFKERYIYIDVGANSYNTSIGTWFLNEYPKQNKPFEIYAIEPDKSFEKEYTTGKPPSSSSSMKITFLPYAAWIRNETLSLQVYKITPNEGETFNYMGYIPENEHSKSYNKEELATMRERFSVEAFDFVEWLEKGLRLTERDYVVMKMDVEGSEIKVLEKMKESGTLCLIDELFLECHYDRWLKCCSGPKSNKYNYTFRQCYDKFKELRQKHGCIAHQWW